MDGAVVAAGRRRARLRLLDDVPIDGPAALESLRYACAPDADQSSHMLGAAARAVVESELFPFWRRRYGPPRQEASVLMVWALD